MFRYTNHVCKKCFLQNDPFHKVTLNEDGVCSLCAKPAPEEARRCLLYTSPSPRD